MQILTACLIISCDFFTAVCNNKLCIKRLLNIQLKFAGSSADVTKIHSSVGLLAAAWRSAHGGPRATVGNFCYAGQTGTARTPYGRLWVTAQSSADSRAPIVDCYVIAWSSNDARAIIHGVSLDCAVYCFMLFYVVMFI